MTPPGTFERVYAAIKQRLREGAYRPGERLEPALLSDELNASVTPVRDALHRLTGERLVDAPRHEGFRAPMMTETRLRQLYSWHLDLMMLALVKHCALAAIDHVPTEEELCGESIEGRLKALFAALVRLSGNPEHLAAFEAVADRLEPVQRVEQAFLDRTETETAEILRAIRTGDRKLLRRSLVQYHRRRDRIVPELLTSLFQR